MSFLINSELLISKFPKIEITETNIKIAIIINFQLLLKDLKPPFKIYSKHFIKDCLL